MSTSTDTSQPSETVQSAEASRANGLSSWTNLREIACNVILSLMFLRFAMVHVQSLMDTVRVSTVLLLIKVLTDVFFYLTRRIPKEVSFNPYDWSIALAGTYAIVFFRPVPGSHDLFVGQFLQFGGMVLQIIGMLSLNRSIGMVPANRGIRTGGLYRFVRHPLYLSYTIAFLGFVINQPSYLNICIYVAALLLWILRLLAEERFLLQDEAYRAYAERVRYRMIPGVF